MSNIFKKYFLLIALGTAFLGFYAFQSFQIPEKDTPELLIVGLQSGYPPFEFLNEKGQIIGFDVDLAHLIASALGKKLVIKDMDFDGLILSLKQGKIDLIMSGMDITPSRMKEIEMIPYHGAEASSLSLIFWNEIPENVHSIEDVAKLLNPIISVESGATPETLLKHYPGIQAKSFQGALNPLMDVKYGKSVANLVEPDVACYLKNKHPEVKILNVPLPKDVAILGFGIGVKNENKQLLNAVKEIIDEIKATGELQALEVKWFQGGNDGK